MHEKQQVIYYRDELNDEFSDGHIDAKKIDGNYRYIRDDSPIGKAVHIFWYRIIATPLAWLYMKLHFHRRYPHSCFIDLFLDPRAKFSVLGCFTLFSHSLYCHCAPQCKKYSYCSSSCNIK